MTGDTYLTRMSSALTDEVIVGDTKWLLSLPTDHNVLLVWGHANNQQSVRFLSSSMAKNSIHIYNIVDTCVHQEYVYYRCNNYVFSQMYF